MSRELLRFFFFFFFKVPLHFEPRLSGTRQGVLGHTVFFSLPLGVMIFRVRTFYRMGLCVSCVWLSRVEAVSTKSPGPVLYPPSPRAASVPGRGGERRPAAFSGLGSFLFIFIFFPV